MILFLCVFILNVIHLEDLPGHKRLHTKLYFMSHKVSGCISKTLSAILNLAMLWPEYEVRVQRWR